MFMGFGAAGSGSDVSSGFETWSPTGQGGCGSFRHP